MSYDQIIYNHFHLQLSFQADLHTNNIIAIVMILYEYFLIFLYVHQFSRSPTKPQRFYQQLGSGCLLYNLRN